MDSAKAEARARGFEIETATILVELKVENFACLLESLKQAEIDPRRIVVNPSVIRPGDGDVVVVHANFLDRYREILACLNVRYTKGFVLLDPYGMKGIPYDMIRQFVALPNADVMINWPFLDIQRKQGRLDRADERTGVGDEANLVNIDTMFGTDRWRQLCGGPLIDTLPEEVSGDLEVNLANLYYEQIQAADATVTVKRVPLMFSEADRTIYYLYLTTHDPCGALKLNEVLDKAKLWELGVRWHLKQDRYVRMQEAAGQQSLFDLAPLKAEPPAPPVRPPVDIPALGRGIHAEWVGQTTIKKEVFRSQANTAVYQGEINRALTWLKTQKMADFTGTNVSDPIRFLRVGPGR